MVAYPRPSFLQIKHFIIRLVVISGAMLLSYVFQREFLDAFNINPRISLFYIPAGVITIAALVSPKVAPIGIFLGALVSNRLYPPWQSFTEDAVMSLIPGLCAIAAVGLLYMAKSKLADLYNDNKSLPNIDAWDILYFCCIYGLLNTSTHQLLFSADHDYGVLFTFTKALGMWFGDFTGSFLVFIALNLGYSASMRLRGFANSYRERNS